MGFAGPTTPGLQQQQPQGQQQPSGDPQLTYEDPMAYIAWLRSKRLDPGTIDRMVTDRFGPGKTPDERAREQAKDQQMGEIGKIGGTLAGMYGAQQLGGLFGGGTAASGGAAAGAGTAGAGTAGAGMGLGSIGAVAGPVALAALAANNAWETGLKDIVRGKGTREDYINQGVNMLTGFLPNLGLRLLGYPSIGQRMTSGKSEPQQLRDFFRTDLRDAGLADADYNVSLANGAKFNIGLDGHTKYTNLDGKTTRNAWDVDFSNPLAKYATDILDPIVRAKYSNQKGLPVEQLTGMLVNAATSNASDAKQIQENIRSMMGQFSPDKMPQYKGGPVTQSQSQQREPAPRPVKKETIRETLNRKMEK
jgi:hypothetical protein